MNPDELLTRRIARVRLELCNDNNATFADRIGKSRQYASALCNGKANASRSTLEIVLAAFPSVNRNWLYFGTGQMLDEMPPTPATKPDLYADIADTYAHLAHLFSRLALCDR